MACDASNAGEVDMLFAEVERSFGIPELVVHNIDGRTMEIFRKPLIEAEPVHVAATLERSAMSAFLVAQQTARCLLERPLPPNGHRGTLIITNASAALKGYPNSAAFAMACHAKSGFAQSMARELMPQGIHVAHVPIDAAVALQRDDGSRAHWSGAAAEEDNMAYPEHIAEVYLQLHRQHRSTWAFEVVLRPWQERW
ncbi:SDR family oxidoreductase [Halopseudomonas maritima]|nr:SDR family oxidoreductase [Halopseudomonas maritima]